MSDTLGFRVADLMSVVDPDGAVLRAAAARITASNEYDTPQERAARKAERQRATRRRLREERETEAAS